MEKLRRAATADTEGGGESSSEESDDGEALSKMSIRARKLARRRRERKREADKKRAAAAKRFADLQRAKARSKLRDVLAKEGLGVWEVRWRQTTGVAYYYNNLDQCDQTHRQPSITLEI